MCIAQEGKGIEGSVEIVIEEIKDGLISSEEQENWEKSRKVGDSSTDHKFREYGRWSD